MRRRYISGSTIRTYVDDVDEFRAKPPKYISQWGRADSIYHCIGCVVRLKERHWRGKPAPPYGLVIEVGRAAWLVALWTDGTSPTEHINGMDVDRWHHRGLHDLKQAILARRYSEQELVDYLNRIDFGDMIATS